MQNADELELYMLTLINEERAAVGAPPLALETSLNASAEDHSEWMLQSDVFSHTGEGGSSATDRMRAADFELSGSWRTAENIAVQSARGEVGFRDDVEDLHRSLMNSPGHRANLLNADLEYVGIGIEVGEFDFGTGEVGSVIVTQNFGTTQAAVSLDPGVADEVAEPEVEAPEIEEPEVVDPQPEPEPEPEVEEPVVEVPENEGPVAEMPEEEPEQAETIMAERGQVFVTGTNGDDVIMGNCGLNVVSGGAGADTFVFAPYAGLDVVVDFEAGVDQFDLGGFGFDALETATDHAVQMDDHVLMRMGCGDALIVLNATLAELEDAILI